MGWGEDLQARHQLKVFFSNNHEGPSESLHCFWIFCSECFWKFGHGIKETCIEGEVQNQSATELVTKQAPSGTYWSSFTTRNITEKL